MKKHRLLLIRFARDVRTGGAPVVVCAVLFGLFLMSLFASVSAEFDLPYSGPVWYASPGGDDTNGVGSEAAPWRSIGKAIAEAAPGDTIKVMDDGDAGTNDYTENITVNKRLCIERYDDDATAPRIKGHNASTHVFNITADSVTIKRLDIYGATANDKAGICLNSVRDCTILDNRCGWVSSHKNHYGILLSSSSNNTVSGNTCDSNNEDGIFLFSSGDNTISGNTCDSNNDNGIYLSSSGDNMVSGNTCPNNGRGIHLLSSDDNTISGNTYSDNTHQGIYLSSSSDNRVFLNEFNNTTNVYSEGEPNIWHSPTKLGYHYGGATQTRKSTMGNSYSDYSGSDSDGDGIGESPYTTGGADDAYPLVQSTDNHDPQMWVLANPVMYKGDLSKPGTTVSIPMSSSQTWCADSLAQADVFFDAGDESDSTSWTGLITFTSTPIAGDNFTVEVGYADDQNGANFWADGPDTTIVGDGSTKVFTYAAHAISFTLPQNKYLALRVTNESVSNGYDVRVGGSWSYCASPLSATSSEVPAGLGATAYPDSVRLNWNANAEPDLDYYVVYRKMSEGEPDSIATVSAPDTTYLDVNVTTGKSYYYRIRAVDHAGRERGYSNEKKATPWAYGDVSGNEEIQAYDAALILQKTVGLADSTDWPFLTTIVADVSGSGGIAAWDASLVLQHVVDLIPQFPVEGGIPPVLVVKPVTSSRVVRLGFAEHLEDGSFLVPIWIDNMDGVLSGRLEVRYNSAILKVKEVRKGLLLGDYLFVSNGADGKALMSFAGSESRQGAGWIAEVVFDLVNRVSEEVSEVRLDAVQLNEGRIAISSAASITVNRILEAYRLAQNFPNPFNARTVVPFDLPAGGKVHLSIYNIAGQRVRTLVNGWQEAGFRSVIWDGRDRGGREVASGVYLVRLEGSDFTEAKRMVLLR